jgi:hypothetical protein
MPTLLGSLRLALQSGRAPMGSIIKDQFASNTSGDVAVMPRPLNKLRARGQSHRNNRMYLLFTMSDNPLNPTCAARRRCRLAAKRIFGLDDSPVILFVFGDSSKNRRGKLKSGARTGGARRDRTDDLVLAKHALSQLSYGPKTQLRPNLRKGSVRSITPLKSTL